MQFARVGYSVSSPPSHQPSKVVFLSVNEIRSFISQDRDNFTKKFSRYDLYARNAHSIEEYVVRSAESACEFTVFEKQLLTHASQQADDFFRTRDIPELKGSSSKDVATLPWKFAKTCGSSYEQGFPHTRHDIIFLSDRVIHVVNGTSNDYERLSRTLVHEKLHVYQRLYPDKLNMSPYIPVCHRSFVSDNYRLRANPDLDEWVYKLKSSDKPILLAYASDKPSSITDTVVNANHEDGEHPYEIMAYGVASRFSMY